eukprot:TRINITY_DN5929_c0_g1_i1.p1 TRINITY_DN5929_c0_g1~~TRINITY_DN5929_c0_g1_i1.p1  ORF type:complete len:583 (+),score=32.92 TRINITY_DN5929_c0_g1_i1:290-2038(+)
MIFFKKEVIARGKSRLQSMGYDTSPSSNVPHTRNRSDKKTLAFFLGWNTVVALTFIIHALLLSDPVLFMGQSISIDHMASNSAGGKVAIMFIMHYMLGIFNSLHGTFLFGAAFRFGLRRRPMILSQLTCMHIYMSFPVAASTGFFLIQWILHPDFTLDAILPFGFSAIQFVFSIFVINSCVRARRLTANDESDASKYLFAEGKRSMRARTYMAKRSFLFIILSCMVAYYGFYNFLLFIIRIMGKTVDMQIGFGQFIQMFVEGYQTGVHRGVIMGFGFHGVIAHYSNALHVYALAECLFAGLNGLSIVKFAFEFGVMVWGGTFELQWLISPLYLLGELTLQLLAIYGSWALWVRLKSAEISSNSEKQAQQDQKENSKEISQSDDSEEAPQEIVLINHAVKKEDKNESVTDLLNGFVVRRAGFTPSWILAVFFWWQLESISLVVLQVVANTYHLSIVSMAINFGFHGVVVFVIGYYGRSSKDKPKSFMIGLYGIFAFVSLDQVVTTATSFKSAYNWDIFSFIIFGFAVVRFLLLLGTIITACFEFDVKSFLFSARKKHDVLLDTFSAQKTTGIGGCRYRKWCIL